MSGKVSIYSKHFLRRLCCIYKKICLICTVRNPHCVVISSLASSRRRTIPQKSISHRRIIYRNSRLGIIMLKINRASFSVKLVLLLLSKPVKMLSFMCVKYYFNLIVVAFPMYISSGIMSLILCMENMFILSVKVNYSPIPYITCFKFYLNHSVRNLCHRFISGY